MIRFLGRLGNFFLYIPLKFVGDSKKIMNLNMEEWPKHTWQPKNPHAYKGKSTLPHPEDFETYKEFFDACQARGLTMEQRFLIEDAWLETAAAEHDSYLSSPERKRMLADLDFLEEKITQEPSEKRAGQQDKKQGKK